MKCGRAKKVYAAVRDITRYRAFSREEDDETIIPLYIDLSKPETIAAAAELSQDVDVVINNAGGERRPLQLQRRADGVEFDSSRAGVMSKTNPLDGNAIEALKSEMEVNVYGLMAMAQAYAPILKKNSAEHGSKTAFVQLNSVASFGPAPRCSGKDFATYSATKAAAYSITRALAQELAPHDVRVLSVHPGPVRTELLPERLLALAEAPSAVAEEVIRALADGTPLHVFPDPHSKQLATIMRPFLTKVVEGGDVYNQGK